MFFFFFKQKTAYEMRISDWSSDVCSSDLRDRDAAGRMAAERLHARGRDAGIEVRDLMPARSDFNVDLRRLGPDAMLARLAGQLVPADALRFLRRRDAA